MKMKYFSALINSRVTFKRLLLFNLLLSVIIFYLFRDLHCGDEEHYLSFAEGFKHGRYSHWWFLKEYFPDTFRTPGYPFFLYLVEKISKNIYFIKCIQFLLYLVSVFMILKIAETYDTGYRLKNIFLFLLLPYIQVAVFTDSIGPEALMTFLITLYIYIDTRKLSMEWKISLLGLLSGIIFLVRPVFLFFPFIVVILNLFRNNRSIPFSMGISMLVIFILTILPYGWWNLKTHHVMSITPIEGAGGVFQLGYWSFRLPGYQENRYWGNVMSDEIISFTKATDKEKNIKAFNREWNYIDSACSQYLTVSDSESIAEMNSYPGFFKTYNTQYTLARERLLKKFTFDNLKKDFSFTLKIKLYTMIRSWITGVQLTDIRNKKISAKVAAIYISLISALVFFASIILVPLAFFKKKLSWKNSQTIILLIIYYGIIHLPFAIQARYTIPLRLLLLLLLARTILNLFSHRPSVKI